MEGDIRCSYDVCGIIECTGTRTSSHLPEWREKDHLQTVPSHVRLMMITFHYLQFLTCKLLGSHNLLTLKETETKLIGGMQEVVASAIDAYSREIEKLLLPTIGKSEYIHQWRN